MEGARFDACSAHPEHVKSPQTKLADISPPKAKFISQDVENYKTFSLVKQSEQLEGITDDGSSKSNGYERSPICAQTHLVNKRVAEPRTTKTDTSRISGL